MQTKCFDTAKFTHKFNDEDQLVIQTFGCLLKTREANSKHTSQLCCSSFCIKPNSSSCLLLPYAALGREMAWHSLVYFGNSCAKSTGVFPSPPPLFFFSSVIAALKFKIILEVLNYHPHSAAETMKKGRNVSNDPGKQ